MVSRHGTMASNLINRLSHSPADPIASPTNSGSSSRPLSPPLPVPLSEVAPPACRRRDTVTRSLQTMSPSARVFQALASRAWGRARIGTRLALKTEQTAASSARSKAASSASAPNAVDLHKEGTADVVLGVDVPDRGPGGWASGPLGCGRDGHADCLGAVPDRDRVPHPAPDRGQAS